MQPTRRHRPQRIQRRRLVQAQQDLRPLYPNGTTCLQLMRDGHRTSTTRRKFADQGSVVAFGDNPKTFDVYIVEEVRPVPSPDIWEQTEGWHWPYIEANPSLLKQATNPASVQTIVARLL